ncbi:MAG: mycothiol synthase [Actinomycetia bacterium]|nr:mycothiol synthase [Actinomycetes bacterium]
MPISLRPQVSAAERSAVLALTQTAADHDGTSALSEASRLALQPDAAPAGHLLLTDGQATIGYAQVWSDASAELVIAPEARRRGHGSTLWRRALAEGAWRVWAHGDLPEARAFAAAHDLVPVRSLLKMGRPLTASDHSPRPLPPTYAVTTFAEYAAHTSSEAALEELRALNAAAFASHPEQGRLTTADLAARMDQPWFDPAGLLLVLDDEHPQRGPVAFHWTKIESDASEIEAGKSDASEISAGEIYVVGVHPDYQGRGLAGPLTDLGLAHLAAAGCTDVELYVDGENTPARATYEKAGLSVLTTDTVYGDSVYGRIER